MASHWDHLQTLMPLKGARVLDLGSGKGKFLVAATRGGARVTGLEPSASYREQTIEYARTQNLTVTVCAGTAEALPFADNSFDFINASEVYEHVEDPQKMLSEMCRVLEFGGGVYMSIPNRFGIKDPHFHLWFVNWVPRAWSDAFIAMFGTHKQYDGDSGHQRLRDMHYRTFTRAKALLRKAGFRAVDIRERKVRDRAPILLPVYWLLRPWFFDSFHFFLTKDTTKILAIYRGKLTENRGTPIRVRSLLERISAMPGFSVTVASWDHQLPFEANHIHLTNNKLADMRALLRAVHKERIQCVIGHTMATWYYLVFLKIFSRAKLVLEMHGFIEREAYFYGSISPARMRMWATVYRLFYPLMDLITTCSENAGEILAPFNKNVVPIYGGVDTDLFNPETLALQTVHREPGTVLIGYAGNTRKWQGVPFLLDSFKELYAKDPTFRLALLSSESKELPAQEGVEFYGQVAHEEVPAFLSACDVLVIPRLDDDISRISFPSKLPEYLAMGKPVVASTTSDAHRVITDGVDGFLFAPGDTASFLDILRTLKDAQLRERVGQAARETALARFRWNSQSAILASRLRAVVYPYVKS